MGKQLPTPEDVLVISRYSRFTSNPLRIGERGLWGGHLAKVVQGGKDNHSLNIQRLAIAIDDIDHLAAMLSLLTRDYPDISEYAKKLIGREIGLLLCLIEEIVKDLAKTDQKTPQWVYEEFLEEFDRVLREHDFYSIRDRLTAHMDALRFKTYIKMNKNITRKAIDEAVRTVKIYLQAVLLSYRTERHMHFKNRNVPSDGATDNYYAGYVPFDPEATLPEGWVPFNDFLRDADPNRMCRYGVDIIGGSNVIRVHLYEGRVERMRADYPRRGMWTVALFIYGGNRGKELVQRLEPLSTAKRGFSLVGEDFELPDSCQLLVIREYPKEEGYRVLIQWTPPAGGYGAEGSE